jgi:hypothetical protein
MTLKFRTKNGSLYELSSEKMTWQRTRKGEESGSIRAESGKLVVWPHIEIGRPVIIQDTNLLPGASVHLVCTSPVVESDSLCICVECAQATVN